MKTPRNILLERHRVVEPKLDAVRRMVLNNKETKEPKRGGILITSFVGILWRELIWPGRRAWAGMAIVWLIILVVNFSMRDSGQTLANSSPTSAETIMAFQQQQRLLAELIDLPLPQDAERPKVILLRPRSEWRRGGWRFNA